MTFKTAFKIYNVVILVNFAAFVVVYVVIGGDAIQGHSAFGYYFVCSHGKCREVSEAVFHYSWWHTQSVYFTIFIGMVVALVDWVRSKISN